MTPESQRIAIAEVCGWKKGGLDCDGFQIWINPSGAQQYEAYIPSYPADLNAMHEAEKVLTDQQQWRWVVVMAEILGMNDSDFDDDRAHFRYAHATAAQRAEVILRTLELWKE